MVSKKHVVGVSLSLVAVCVFGGFVGLLVKGDANANNNVDLSIEGSPALQNGVHEYLFNNLSHTYLNYIIKHNVEIDVLGKDISKGAEVGFTEGDNGIMIHVNPMIKSTTQVSVLREAIELVMDVEKRGLSLDGQEFDYEESVFNQVLTPH